jgi:D-alanine-D-alanine ligase-like ATP-grasp enzyme
MGLLFSDERFCQECQQSSLYHLNTWLGEIIDRLLPKLPRKFISTRLEFFIERAFVSFLTATGIARWRSDFTAADIQQRSFFFAEEGKRRGMWFEVLAGPWGITCHFRGYYKGKTFYFEGLPGANMLDGPRAELLDDKKYSKHLLREGGFPVAEGRTFWFFQKSAARRYGGKLGFPLVVKPRSGSVARHVTTDIASDSAFDEAVRKALAYGPAFVVERYLEGASVHRGTVVDFEHVAVARQVPANVTGDGTHTIQELVGMKNADARRGNPWERQYTLYKIVLNDAALKRLEEQGHTPTSVPPKGRKVFLQRDPFLRWGGDVEEVTPSVHPDNLKLYKEIARFFDVRLVGIDILFEDVSKFWREQRCAVLELNSSPCIELHHAPFLGQPQPVASWVADLIGKYY